MALIDVYQLCLDNAAVLKHEDGTYHFTAYQLIDGTNYTVRDITGPGQYFIAPQRAVGLIADTEGKSLTIKLEPDALVALTSEGTIVNDASIRGGGAGAPVRRAAKAAASATRNYLYISAANETTDEWGNTVNSKAYLTLGESENATRGYKPGEDALNISSGLNYYSDGSFSTPISMYTIADNRALMYDMRDSMNMVPLAFTTLDSRYSISNYTLLSFATEGDWSKPLYLYDALTGDSLLIVNGLKVSVETPLNDQIRYYINGGHRTVSPEAGDPGIATGIELINEEQNDQTVNDQIVNIFDVLGRKVATLQEHDLISNTVLPTGVYIISRGDKTERIVIK